MFIRLTTAVVSISAAVAAFAQPDIHAGKPDSAYAQDSRGVVLRTPYGLCVRSGYWTEGDSVIGCDGKLEAPVAKTTAPPPPEPAPAPAAAMPTPPVAPRRCDSTLVLGADETFAFNKSALTTAAQRRIERELPGRLAACSKVELILVTGHGDRIGSDSANQRISEKRAEAVAAYIRSIGINAPIRTSGAGKTRPVQECAATLPRKTLSECLAANRRVEIEVRGLGK